MTNNPTVAAPQELTTTPCGDGQHADVALGRCIPNCGVADHFDPITNHCASNIQTQPPTGTGNTGTIVLKKLPNGSCPSGYHLVADVVCIKDI